VTHRDVRYSIGLVCVWSIACSYNSMAQAAATQQLAVEGATWTKVLAPSIATARASHVFVYDEARENCVVFGGRPVDDSGRSFEDTGLWDGDTWVPVAAEYGRRGNVTGAFDDQRQLTVVYGGTDGVWFFDDTWEFDGSGWTERTGDSPGDRSGNGLVYDSRRNVTVLFGGYDGFSWKDELWEWDGNTWAQGCTAEPCSVQPRPAARANAVFVYDDARGVSLLFGGSQDEQSYNDTWSWDGERWRELQPTLVPMARASAAATYDPVSKRILMFGGLATGLQELNDFWAWDGRNWTSISQTTVPFARHGAGMVWHAEARRGILFGGSSSGRETDAWEFNLFGSPCTSTEECHVGSCVQGSCPIDPDSEGSADGGTSSGAGSVVRDASSDGSGDSAADNGGSVDSGTIDTSPIDTSPIDTSPIDTSPIDTSTVDTSSVNGGEQANPGGGAVSDAWPPLAASSGAVADLGGAGAAEAASSSASDDTPAARSFYSCALSATSRATQGPPTAVLTALTIWFTRRRKTRRNRTRCASHQR
jgi:hypothetical protein